jgi:hypothetical protein
MVGGRSGLATRLLGDDVYSIKIAINGIAG